MLRYNTKDRRLKEFSAWDFVLLDYLNNSVNGGRNEICISCGLEEDSYSTEEFLNALISLVNGYPATNLLSSK